MTYAEKLKDPLWQKKRLEILDRDGWACVYCFDNESTLHVHHKKYNGEPFESDSKDLETTCKYCHALIEFYKNFEGVKFKRYNCSGGKLFMTTVKGDNKIYFDIIDHEGYVTELCSFDREILYALKKFFK